MKLDKYAGVRPHHEHHHQHGQVEQLLPPGGSRMPSLLARLDGGEMMGPHHHAPISAQAAQHLSPLSGAGFTALGLPQALHGGGGAPSALRARAATNLHLQQLDTHAAQQQHSSELVGSTHLPPGGGVEGTPGTATASASQLARRALAASLAQQQHQPSPQTGHTPSGARSPNAAYAGGGRSPSVSASGAGGAGGAGSPTSGGAPHSPLSAARQAPGGEGSPGAARMSFSGASGMYSPGGTTVRMRGSYNGSFMRRQQPPIPRTAKEIVAQHFWKHYEKYRKAQLGSAHGDSLDVDAAHHGAHGRSGRHHHHHRNQGDYSAMEFGFVGASYEVHVTQVLEAERERENNLPLRREDETQWQRFLASLTREEAAAIVIQRWWRAWLDFRRITWPEMYDKPLEPVAKAPAYVWSSSEESDEPEVRRTTVRRTDARRKPGNKAGFGTSAVKPMNKSGRAPKPDVVEEVVEEEVVAPGKDLIWGSAAPVKHNRPRLPPSGYRPPKVTASRYLSGIGGGAPNPNRRTRRQVKHSDAPEVASLPADASENDLAGDEEPEPARLPARPTSAFSVRSLSRHGSRVERESEDEEDVEDVEDEGGEKLGQLPPDEWEDDDEEEQQGDGQPAVDWDALNRAAQSVRAGLGTAGPVMGHLKFWGGLHNPKEQHDSRFFLPHLGQVHVVESEKSLYNGAVLVRAVSQVLKPFSPEPHAPNASPDAQPAQQQHHQQHQQADEAAGASAAIGTGAFAGHKLGTPSSQRGALRGLGSPDLASSGFMPMLVGTQVLVSSPLDRLSLPFHPGAFSATGAEGPDPGPGAGSGRKSASRRGGGPGGGSLRWVHELHASYASSGALPHSPHLAQRPSAAAGMGLAGAGRGPRGLLHHAAGALQSHASSPSVATASGGGAAAPPVHAPAAAPNAPPPPPVMVLSSRRPKTVPAAALLAPAAAQQQQQQQQQAGSAVAAPQSRVAAHEQVAELLGSISQPLLPRLAANGSPPAPGPASQPALSQAQHSYPAPAARSISLSSGAHATASPLGPSSSSQARTSGAGAAAAGDPPPSARGTAAVASPPPGAGGDAVAPSSSSPPTRPHPTTALASSTAATGAVLNLALAEAAARREQAPMPIQSLVFKRTARAAPLTALTPASGHSTSRNAASRGGHPPMLILQSLQPATAAAIATAVSVGSPNTSPPRPPRGDATAGGEAGTQPLGGAAAPGAAIPSSSPADTGPGSASALPPQARPPVAGAATSSASPRHHHQPAQAPPAAPPASTGNAGVPAPVPGAPGPWSPGVPSTPLMVLPGLGGVLPGGRPALGTPLGAGAAGATGVQVLSRSSRSSVPGLADGGAAAGRTAAMAGRLPAAGGDEGGVGRAGAAGGMGSLMPLEGRTAGKAPPKGARPIAGRVLAQAPPPPAMAAVRATSPRRTTHLIASSHDLAPAVAAVPGPASTSGRFADVPSQQLPTIAA